MELFTITEQSLEEIMEPGMEIVTITSTAMNEEHKFYERI